MIFREVEECDVCVWVCGFFFVLREGRERGDLCYFRFACSISMSNVCVGAPPLQCFK